MANPKRVKSFLGRLETTVNEGSIGWNALRGREEQNLKPYVKHKSWPGETYMYIGHSNNLEHKLVGTRTESKRKTCLGLLFEAKGDENYCVRLDDAMKFEGFHDNLSRFEKDLLAKMPPHTMLGPSYDKSGKHLPTSFTIWRPSAEEKAKTPKKRVLIKA